MKKAIEIKLNEIEAQMEQMKDIPLYYLTAKWKCLHAVREALGEILQSA